MAYIALYSCGCIYAVIVDDPTIPGNNRRIAKFIMAEVKFGGTIERVTGDFVRQSAKEEWFFNCIHGNNPEDKKPEKKQRALI